MKNKIIKALLFFISFLIILFSLLILSRFNYLLFHSIIEFSSIIIGITLFFIVINTTKFAKNSFLFFIGISYLTVSIIDFLHALAYSGMGVFPGYTFNLATSSGLQQGI